MGTGCACSVSSLRAAELLQIERREEEPDFWHEVTPTDKKFGFANGLSHRCVFQVEQEFPYGLLAGETVTFQILDQPGNSTAPLLSISDLSSLGAVLDLSNSSISIRGRPPVRVPQTSTGLIILPVTKGAVARWDSIMAEGAVTGNPAAVGDPASANLAEDAPKEKEVTKRLLVTQLKLSNARRKFVF